jgi:hypothetical protein
VIGLLLHPTSQTRAQSAGGDSTGVSVPTDTPTVYEYPANQPPTTDEIARNLRVPSQGPKPIYQYQDRQGKTMDLFVLPPEYDRVEELAIRLAQSLYHTDKAFYPSVKLYQSYSTGLEHIYYRGDLEQPVLGSRRMVLGVSGYNEVAVVQDMIGRVGATENSMAALFFREDFRNYYQRSGFLFSLSAGLVRGFVPFVLYRSERHTSLSNTTNGSVFSVRREAFRPNPPINPGQLRSWSVGVDIDSDGFGFGPGVVHRVRFEYETTGPQYRSTFDYDAWSAESRTVWRLTPDQHLRVRMRAGSVARGELPVQKQFYLGGLGTLRAMEYASIRGDRNILANIEYVFNVVGQLQAVAFGDVGDAWYGPLAFRQIRPEVNAGLALTNRTGRFRINVARDLRAEHAPLVMTVRVQPF